MVTGSPRDTCARSTHRPLEARQKRALSRCTHSPQITSNRRVYTTRITDTALALGALSTHHQSHFILSKIPQRVCHTRRNDDERALHSAPSRCDCRSASRERYRHSVARSTARDMQTDERDIHGYRFREQGRHRPLYGVPRCGGEKAWKKDCGAPPRYSRSS